jgi:hypothetical protein
MIHDDIPFYRIDYETTYYLHIFHHWKKEGRQLSFIYTIFIFITSTLGINIYSIWHHILYVEVGIRVMHTCAHIVAKHCVQNGNFYALVKEPPAFANNHGERDIVYPYYVFYTVSFPNVYSVANPIRSS